MTERVLKQYLRAVARRLPCNRRRRRELLVGLREELVDRMAGQPVTHETLEHTVGTPAAVAARMSEELTDREVLRGHWARLFRTAMAAVLVALVLWVGVVAYAAVREARLGPWHSTFSISINDIKNIP